MKRKSTARGASSTAIETLEQVVSVLNPETEPGELAAQMVRALAAPGRLEGARLWRIVNGTPAVWQESGELPPADLDGIKNVLHGRGAGKDGRSHTWLLGRAGDPVGVLETSLKGTLDEKTRIWLDLFRRYAEVALESSERRNAVIELSTIVEATKRLNSTLDLAELLNIILQLTTRQTGAERGTVFLIDHERHEIWSLVGMGLDQHEIRLPISRGIAGCVAATGDTINLADAYADPRFESEGDLRLGFRTARRRC